MEAAVFQWCYLFCSVITPCNNGSSLLFVMCSIFIYDQASSFLFHCITFGFMIHSFFCAISATNEKKIKGIFYALSHDIFCGAPWKAWESENCWFAVWVLASHFCHSPLWKTQILFVSTRPVTGWHLCSGVFSKAETKSLPPASGREKRPDLWIVLETEHSSG